MLTKLEMGLTIQLTIFRNGVKKNKIKKETCFFFLFFFGCVLLSLKRDNYVQPKRKLQLQIKKTKQKLHTFQKKKLKRKKNKEKIRGFFLHVQMFLHLEQKEFFLCGFVSI